MTTPTNARVRSGALIELVLVPGRFFPAGARNLGIPLLLVLIALLGMSGVIDRLEWAALRSGASNEGVRIADDWAQYWGAVFAGAFLAGPIAYWVGGWWATLRVRLCGVDNPSAPLVRHIYLLSSAIVTVSSLTIAGVDAFRYPDPRSAWVGTEPIAWTLFVMPFWGVFINYRGICASFDVVRSRARVWFAILPSIVYAGAIVFGIIVGFDLFG